MIERPRRNRVTPFGMFEATSAKGLFLGNRGDIHARDGGVSGRQWAVKAWISCTLSPKSGNRIEFDRKGTYYPLFFADEVTALAAGHRPCAMCRYQDYQRFKRFWQQANGKDENGFVSAVAIDGELHAARVDASRRKIVHAAKDGDLPDGVMVIFSDSSVLDSSAAYLLWRGQAHRWSQSGYTDRKPIATGAIVNVLTPAPLVDVLRAGYVPVVHPSALAG